MTLGFYDYRTNDDLTNDLLFTKFYTLNSKFLTLSSQLARSSPHSGKNKSNSDLRTHCQLGEQEPNT